MTPRVIAVIGPTAAGKTSAALRIAGRFNGEIVSCDSVQIYRELDIGSAKPTAEEQLQIPHHLIGLFNPDFRIDVGIFKKLAEEAIASIIARGKMPILCGGTGMYFNSLFYGLFDAPSRDDSIRSNLEERALSEGVPSLYEELRKADPVSASKILPNDKRRIVRALEVWLKTGTPISELQSKNNRMDLRWLVFGVSPDRGLLYQNIEKRVDAMLAAGLVDETRRVMEKYGRDAYALGSIGYRHSRDLIEGKWGIEEMTAALKQDTRHYARRQLIWFRKVKETEWFDPAQSDVLLARAVDFLEKEGGPA